MQPTGFAESMMNSVTSSAAAAVTTNTFLPPSTPSLPRSCSHRDGHHANHLIKAFARRTAPQMARGMTDPTATPRSARSSSTSRKLRLNT
jgi:hypothetical protein